MKPATWYLMMIVVGFFYIYVTLVQYIRGQEAPAANLDGFRPSYDPKYYDQELTRSTNKLDFDYHNYERMTAFLRAMSATYPNLTALYSIGKSVQGRELWVMVVSSSPYEQILGQPNVKLVANMHGNEAIGREMLLHLIEHLAKSYNRDNYIRWLLDNTRIHIMPAMNPDGFEMSKEGTCLGGRGRYNAQGFDLNRNFPDYFKSNNKETQPETEAVKQWLSKIQFVLSANLHGGALVASYPFDNSPNHMDFICDQSPLCTTAESTLDRLIKLLKSGFNYTDFEADSDGRSVFQQATSKPSLTPDNDVFKHLAQIYSFNHRTMHLGLPCKRGAPSFTNGTTNGASWYPLTGGMQDYNYVWQGCMDVTVEISCCKYPPSAKLPKFWEQNKMALVKYLGEVHRGIRGFVTDGFGRPIQGASLKISGRDVGFQTTKHGEYWRILLPGTYTLEVYADTFHPAEEIVVVEESGPTQFNVTLYGNLPPKSTGSLPYQPVLYAPKNSAQERSDYRRPNYLGASGHGMGPMREAPKGGFAGFITSISEGLSNMFNFIG